MVDASAPPKVRPAAPSLPCPQCQAPIAPDDRFCHVCGVDLAFAALLAEREVLARIPAGRGEPYVADANLPRLGEYLLRNIDQFSN